MPGLNHRITTKGSGRLLPRLRMLFGGIGGSSPDVDYLFYIEMQFGLTFDSVFR
jgi:hypothetical protein